jgi:hypothetical protein
VRFAAGVLAAGACAGIYQRRHYAQPHSSGSIAAILRHVTRSDVTVRAKELDRVASIVKQH